MINQQVEQQQKGISNLQKEVQELWQQVSQGQSSKSMTDNHDFLKKSIHILGWIYGYMKNIFLHSSEFPPSPYSKKYDPQQRFGGHLCEGNFWESRDWIPEQYEPLMDDTSLFAQHVSQLY